MNAAGAAVDNTIGLIAGGIQANRQMKNQRKLMAEQLAIDKLKMEEQRKIQMQMWKDTNYAAQVEDRAHRIGAKSTVNIITLVCKNTMDEVIGQIIADKGELADYIVDGVPLKNKLANLLDIILK